MESRSRLLLFAGTASFLALVVVTHYWPGSPVDGLKETAPQEPPVSPTRSSGKPDEAPFKRPGRTPIVPTAEDGRIVVRCVDAVGGQGIEEVTVDILTWPIEMQPQERHSHRASRCRGSTGREGVYSAKELPAREFWAELHLAKDGYVPLRTNPLRVGRMSHDLGTVRLASGVRVTGTVTDGDGVRVSGCELTLGPFSFLQTSSAGVELFTRTEAYSCESNASGEFAFETAVGPGTWSVSIDPEFILMSPRRLETESSSEPVRLDVVVARPPPGRFLEGVVQDPGGNGLANVRVAVAEADQAGHAVSGGTTTDDAGFFHVEVKGLGADVMKILVSPSTDDYQAASVPGPFCLGTRGIRVTLEEARTISLLVVRADTGAPVTDFRIVTDPSLPGAVRSETRPAHHPEGRVGLKGLTELAYGVFVVPASPDLAMAGPILVHSGATRETRIALEPALAEYRFQIVNAARTPIPGARIRLIEVRDGGFDGVDPVIITRGEVNMIPMLKRRGYGILAGSGESGPEGRAVVKSCSSDLQPGSMVEVVHPDYAGTRIQLSRLERIDSTLVVTLSAGASLHGRIRGLSGSAGDTALDKNVHGIASTIHGRLSREGISIRYHDRSIGAHGLHAGRVAPIGDSGSFELRGLPPGRCDILLLKRLPGTTPLSPVHEVPLVTGALLVDGETTNVDVPYAGTMENPVDITFVTAGQPVAGRQLWVYRLTDSGREHPDPVLRGVATDAAGNVRFELPIGRYRLALASPGGTDGRILCEPPISVTEGRGFQGSREVVVGRIKLRILSHSDNVLTRNRRMVIRAGRAYSCEVVTDRNAECEVSPFPGDREFTVSPGFCWSSDHELLRGLDGLSETAVRSIAAGGRRWVGVREFGPFRAGSQRIVEVRLADLLR